MTLDDMSFILHLPVHGCHLDNKIITKKKWMVFLVVLLELGFKKTFRKLGKTKRTHARLNILEEGFNICVIAFLMIWRLM